MTPMARSRRTPLVLLLIETSRAYGRGLVEGITRYAEESGPWSILFEERGLTDPLPRWLPQWRGDGILSRMPNRANLDRLLALRRPVVELYADKRLGLGAVHPDDRAIAHAAVEHFLDRGVRHFAFFCTDQASWIAARRRAFEEELAGRNLMCHSFDFAMARRKSHEKPRPIDDPSVVRWLAALPKPCGAFCASDFYAMRLARTCRTIGVVVPEQIAVLGVDNDAVFCGTSYPPLSSIDVAPERIGYEAAALLDRMMSGRRPPEQGIAVAPQQVVTRQSTDILAIDDADMAQAVRLIREQACQQLRVAQVADQIGLSRRVFERRFRQVLHRTPKEEILRVQMERAKMLLATSEMAVALVAKKCGFTSLEYFSRAFRRRAGITPRDYRGQQRVTTRSETPETT